MFKSYGYYLKSNAIFLLKKNGTVIIAVTVRVSHQCWIPRANRSWIVGSTSDIIRIISLLDLIFYWSDRSWNPALGIEPTDAIDYISYILEILFLSHMLFYKCSCVYRTIHIWYSALRGWDLSNMWNNHWIHLKYLQRFEYVLYDNNYEGKQSYSRDSVFLGYILYSI